MSGEVLGLADEGAGLATPAQTILVIGARGVPDVEGGAEKGAEATFPLIAQAGYRVVLVGLSRYIKSTSFRGVELRKAPELRLLKTDKLGYYLYAVLIALKLKPDIVHLQGLGAALFLWVYKLLGFKVVVRYGSADYLVAKWGFWGRMGFLASEYQLRFADAVIAVAPALRARLAERGITKNVHVMANAVDEVPDLDRSAPDVSIHADLLNGPFLLAVGRITAQKNVLALIEGYRHLRKTTGAPHKLVIVGGLDETDYVDQVRPLLGDDVVLVGRLPRSEIGPFYARCSAYLNASVHEGSSNAVLEAMSWNAPLLLSDIPENRDFGLEDRHYFAPSDPAATGAAMAALLANPTDYVVATERCMTWPIVAQKTSSIYQAISSP
jgi:glycosyltransferase involved in cell wall biosynthesis